MAANLIEDCLQYIFDYLKPHEWIHISEVCQSWQRAVLRMWKRITTIDSLSLTPYEDELLGKAYTTISAETADKIILCAAPFVKKLKMYPFHRLVMFGSYWYKVDCFDSENALELLAKNATEITDIQAYGFKFESLKPFFERNKITNFRCSEAAANFYHDVPTDGIEELDTIFHKIEDIQDFVSFNGQFPNLKNLKLDLDCYVDPQQLLSKILPFVRGLNSLSLRMSIHHPRSRTANTAHTLRELFSEITQFSQLERLSLIVRPIKPNSSDLFFTELGTTCPKLRHVDMHIVNEKELSSLLSLPRLESLDVYSVLGFHDMNLPEIKNLTELKMIFKQKRNITISSLCSAISKMPKLLNLYINTPLRRGLSYKQQLELTCGVAVVASLQQKNVIVKDIVDIGDPNDSNDYVLMIRRKNDQEAVNSCKDQFQTLNLELNLQYQKKLYFKSIQEFVQKNLKLHHAVVIKNCPEWKRTHLLISDDSEDFYSTEGPYDFIFTEGDLIEESSFSEDDSY